MNKKNYDVEMNKELQAIKEKMPEKASLLLHACCAPCSSTCMERVREELETTVYFFNPNITNEGEYTKRSEELVRLIGIYNDMEGMEKAQITYIEGAYNPKEFTEIAKGLEDCPERGERCFRCYELRLKDAARYAAEHGYDYYTTTLTLSPLKDVDKLNEIGYRLADEINREIAPEKELHWLPSDFKKRGGYQRSIELSKEYDLYRQDYCGCIYSKLERERQKEGL